MSEEKKTRIKRTTEERSQELDAKIAYHNACIVALKAKKELLLAPPKERVRKTSMSAAMKALKESGMSPDDILKLAIKASNKQ